MQHKRFLLFAIFFNIIQLKFLMHARAAVLVQQPILSTVEICRQETGATEADFETLIKKSKPLTMAAKCMRACLMKKFRLMDDNGKFNREGALHIVGDYVGSDPEQMRVATEIVNICDSLAVSDNHCEAAEEYGKCASKQVKARGIQYG